MGGSYGEESANGDKKGQKYCKNTPEKADEIKLVFVNGQYSQELSSLPEQKGLTISTLKEALTQNEVEIKGELDDLTKEFIFEKQGKVIVIRIELPKRNINHGDGSNIQIRVPKASRVDFNGISTDITLKDIEDLPKQIEKKSQAIER